MLTQPSPDPPARWTVLGRLTLLGAIGSVLIAASSWWVGAIPLSFRSRPPAVIDRIGVGSALPLGGFYAGLALLTLSWLLLGRHLLRAPKEVDRGSLLRLILWWALPMLAAMPIASRDVWAYAAQGHLDNSAFDPYRISPAQLSGVFADNVSSRWVNSTSPYGPLWLMVGRGVAFLTGGHVQAAIFLLRLPALIGFVMIVWALPRIAQRLRRRGDIALWLAAASPLVVVIGLGGGHNDLLMAGLAVLGVLAAVSTGSPLNTLALAAALTAAGAAVKSPALISVAFVAPLWLLYGDQQRRARSWRRVGLTAAVTACAALISLGGFTLLARHGSGWADETGSGAQANWISLPTSAAIVVKLLTGHTDGATTVDAAMRHWRTGGLALAGVVLVGLWLSAVRAALGRPARRLDPMTALAAGLVAIVLLGPAVQPWYFGWALPFAALVLASRTAVPIRAVGAVVAATVALVLMVGPDGRGLQMQPIMLGVLAVAVLAGVLTVRGLGPKRPPVTEHHPGPALGSAQGDDDPDSARPGVGAHRRRDL